MDTETPKVYKNTEETAQSIPFIDQTVNTTPVILLAWYEKYKTALIIGGVIATIVAGSLVFQASVPKKIVLPPAPTPTLYPTPTPDRKLSPLSGLKEFRDIDAEVSSLSAHLDSVALDDPSLIPPVLTLPLGFSN